MLRVATILLLTSALSAGEPGMQASDALLVELPLVTKPLNCTTSLQVST